MFPRSFDYKAAQSVAEAAALVTEQVDGAHILAGGQSLIPMMKLRLASPKVLIDISRIPGLSSIRKEKDFLKIGALATHAQVEAAPEVRSLFPMMYDAASVIATPQVRNLGTIGGALAHADPAGDWGPVMLALNARFKCQAGDGERMISAREFFSDAYTTRLRPGEILTEVWIPMAREHSAGAFLKFVRRSGNFAIVSVAVQLSTDADGRCKDVALGFGGVGLTPLSVPEAGGTLKGTHLSGEPIETAARQISKAVDPLSDINGSSKYKREMAAVVFKRAIEIARRRSKGEQLNGGYV